MNVLINIIAWPLGIMFVLVILRHLILPGWQPGQQREVRQRREKPRGDQGVLCEAGHYHETPSTAGWCFEARVAANANLVRAAAADYSATPCPDCAHNHFGPCPPGEPANTWVRHGDHKGARVTDARTGEVIGYWKPKDRA